MRAVLAGGFAMSLTGAALGACSSFSAGAPTDVDAGDGNETGTPVADAGRDASEGGEPIEGGASTPSFCATAKTGSTLCVDFDEGELPSEPSFVATGTPVISTAESFSMPASALIQGENTYFSIPLTLVTNQPQYLSFELLLPGFGAAQTLDIAGVTLGRCSAKLVGTPTSWSLAVTGSDAGTAVYALQPAPTVNQWSSVSLTIESNGTDIGVNVLVGGEQSAQPIPVGEIATCGTGLDATPSAFLGFDAPSDNAVAYYDNVLLVGP